MSSPKTITARDRILEAAEDLFYREGVRAVGIDRIIQKSGVAKMSLYRSFASKDELVAAYLELRSDRYWQWWDTVVAQHSGKPEQQLRDIFQATIERVQAPGFRGCAFGNVAIEFPEENSRARIVALSHKEKRRTSLLRLCEDAGADDPKDLANQLLLLMEGIYAVASLPGGLTAIASAGGAADVLIASAKPKR